MVSFAPEPDLAGGQLALAWVTALLTRGAEQGLGGGDPETEESSCLNFAKGELVLFPVGVRVRGLLGLRGEFCEGDPPPGHRGRLEGGAFRGVGEGTGKAEPLCII